MAGGMAPNVDASVGLAPIELEPLARFDMNHVTTILDGLASRSFVEGYHDHAPASLEGRGALHARHVFAYICCSYHKNAKLQCTPYGWFVFSEHSAF